MKDGKVSGVREEWWLVVCASHDGGMKYRDREAAEVCAAGHRWFLRCDGTRVVGESTWAALA